MKKQSKFYTKYIAFVSLCLLIVGGFFAVSALQSGTKLDVVGVEKDNPYYSLRKNATQYQKDVYKEITQTFKEEPLDQAKISSLVVKNFVADFYTWTNKLRFNDVGGLQYLEKDIQGWVNAQALETFYGDMAYYLENGGLADTLEIKDVRTTVTKGTFILAEETIVYDEYGDPETIPATPPVDSYTVHATWTYVDSSRIASSEFQKEAVFTLIADEEGLFSIVEVQDVKEAE